MGGEMKLEGWRMFHGQTIEARMTETGGRTTGFDALRVALSIAVLCWHSILTSYGAHAEVPIWTSPLRALPSFILPTFFALSGFLVAGSLLRTKSISGFVTLRVLRIVPALSVEVFLSALVLGPLLTTATLDKYFLDPKLHIYFLNSIGWIHFKLPGLFLENPCPDIVNLSLWTVPWELECYMALVVLAVIGAAWRPRLFLYLVVIANVLLPIRAVLDGHLQRELRPPSGGVLVLCFLAGVSIHLLKSHIKLNGWSFFVALVASLIFLAHTKTVYFLPFPIAYMTVYLGLRDVPKLPVFSGGDYSYGIYLYAFPMQQAFAYLFPSYRHWWLNILFALPASLACAMLSWKFVEKPMLRYRGRVVSLVEMMTKPLANGLARVTTGIAKAFFF